MPTRKPTSKRLGNLLGVDLSTVFKICTKCGIEKAGTEFHKKSGINKYGPFCYLASECKSCAVDISKRTRISEKNKERWSAYGFRNHLMFRYGITQEQYEKMYEEQKGLCSICGSEGFGVGDARRLNVDHDHTTNKVRGLLCSSCNNGLGRFKDNIEFLKKAVDYLEKANAG